jgi:two-component system, LuxR family, sensor kinase FixL
MTRAAVRKPAAAPRLVKAAASSRLVDDVSSRLVDDEAPPLAALAPFDAMGDAVALIDRRQRTVAGGTRALAQVLEAAGVDLAWPAPLSAWGAALPGLLEGLDAMHGAGEPTRDAQEDARGNDRDDARADAHHPPHRWRCGAAEDLAVEATALDPRWLLLRLHDDRQHRREQREALRRQLHDRESLLFTSRSVSVGEVGSVLAHELNQPIGAVANLLRGLRLRVARRALDDAAAAEELQAIERAIDQVMFAARVIQRIREFTHARAPQLEALDLVRLLHGSASLLDWDWQRTGVALELDIPAGPVHVRGDATMLQQVVANLMRNALDALREHPPATPHVVLALRRQGEEAVVSIADNGAGMSEQAEQRLFVPFTSSKPTGLGIGLSICRSFVELHQGRLWFTRNDGGGCTFHFRLPLAHAAAAAGAGAGDGARAADIQGAPGTPRAETRGAVS